MDWRSDEIVGEHRRYAKVNLAGELEDLFPQHPDPKVPPVVNPPINSEEPNDFVKMIEVRQRASTPATVAAADETMNKRFRKNKCVLVIEMYQQAEVAHEHGAFITDFGRLLLLNDR
jgi:hypothetical protein